MGTSIASSLHLHILRDADVALASNWPMTAAAASAAPAWICVTHRAPPVLTCSGCRCLTALSVSQGHLMSDSEASCGTARASWPTPRFCIGPGTVPSQGRRGRSIGAQHCGSCHLLRSLQCQLAVASDTGRLPCDHANALHDQMSKHCGQRHLQRRAVHQRELLERLALALHRHTQCATFAGAWAMHGKDGGDAGAPAVLAGMHEDGRSCMYWTQDAVDISKGGTQTREGKSSRRTSPSARPSPVTSRMMPMCRCSRDVSAENCLWNQAKGRLV